MARPRRQTFTMKQYIDNLKEGYISNNASTQRNPAWKPIVDGLAVTILTDDYIPPIILSERDDGLTIIVDGGSRTGAFRMICEGNYKIKSSVEDPIIPYKKIEKDKNGKTMFIDAEFDIRNKTFEQFPKELQKKFYEYQLETVIHEHCNKDRESKYLRRYNSNTGMNANQKMFNYIPKFAEQIREITNRQFFVSCNDIKDNEKEKGTLERVIAESIMCMFHIDKWNKNGKLLATYLNTNSTYEEFEKLNNNLIRLENIVTDKTKTLFNKKDSFIWFTLFEKFTKLCLDDSQFTKFLNEFVNGLRNKSVNGKLFDTVDETGSTKDKTVIITKLHILETLMNEFLHINETNVEAITDVEFISKNVGLSLESVKEDMEVYNDDLDTLLDNTVKIGLKIRNQENRLSLLAMVAYSYKKDMDLDKWFAQYDRKNTYYADQRINFIHMRQDFDQYCREHKISI